MTGFCTTLGISKIDMERIQDAYSAQSLNGTEYFVDASISQSGDGQSWENAFKTLTEAVSVATTRNDIINVAPGDYDEDAVINITTQGLTIRAVDYSGGHHNRAMIYSGSASHLMTINNNEVTIAGIGFSAVDNGYDAVRIATTVSSYKVAILDCRFDGWSGEHAIYVGDTYDAPDLAIISNEFRSWDTACLRLNATRALVKGNLFILEGATKAIIHEPNAGNRPDTVIINNTIYGVNSGDTGISITNTPTEELFHVSGNSIINCATPITAEKYTSWYEDNYFGNQDEKYHPEAATDYGMSGTVYHVDKLVSASGDGLCRKSAFKTIAEAVTASNATIDWGASPWAPSHVIRIANGSYAENLTSLPYGALMIGDGDAWDADGENGVRIKPAAGSPVDVNSCINCQIKNINFESPDTSRVFDAAVLNNVQLIHCRFAGAPEATTSTAGIYTNDSVMLTVRDCRIEYVDCGIDFVYADGGDSMTRCLIDSNYMTYISEAGVRISLNLVTPASRICNNFIGGGGATLAIGIDNNVATPIVHCDGNFISATDGIEGYTTGTYVGGNYCNGVLE